MEVSSEDELSLMMELPQTESDRTSGASDQTGGAVSSLLLACFLACVVLCLLTCLSCRRKGWAPVWLPCLHAPGQDDALRTGYLPADITVNPEAVRQGVPDIFLRHSQASARVSMEHSTGVSMERSSGGGGGEMSRTNSGRDRDSSAAWADYLRRATQRRRDNGAAHSLGAASGRDNGGADSLAVAGRDNSDADSLVVAGRDNGGADSLAVAGRDDGGADSLAVAGRDNGGADSLAVAGRDNGGADSLAVAGRDNGGADSLALAGRDNGGADSLALAGRDNGGADSLGVAGRDNGGANSLAVAGRDNGGANSLAVAGRDNGGSDSLAVAGRDNGGADSVGVVDGGSGRDYEGGFKGKTLKATRTDWGGSGMQYNTSLSVPQGAIVHCYSRYGEDGFNENSEKASNTEAMKTDCGDYEGGCFKGKAVETEAMRTDRGSASGGGGNLNDEDGVDDDVGRKLNTVDESSDGCGSRMHVGDDFECGGDVDGGDADQCGSRVSLI